MDDFFQRYIQDIEILGELALAIFLGALIGAEREVAGKPAGLRTQMLVAGASSLVVSISAVLVESFNNEMISNLINADPTRVVVAVVTGVSFIGAGTIIRSDAGDVEGLTTASSLLFTAVIGICIGSGLIILGIGATILGLVILRVLGFIDDKLRKIADDKRKNNSN